MVTESAQINFNKGYMKQVEKLESLVAKSNFPVPLMDREVVQQIVMMNDVKLAATEHGFSVPDSCLDKYQIREFD